MTTRQSKSASVQHKATPSRIRFVVCVNNADYPVSLEKRKLYQVLSDPQARRHNLLRVVDESGEDYLYPADWFVPIAITRMVAKALAFAA
jgi:hypothetical protein